MILPAFLHRFLDGSVMPAEAGIQGREGMDTGLRRYDGTFVSFVVKNVYCYMRNSLSALSSRINFFCFGEISGRSRMPLTVLGNVESKCG